MKMTGSAEKKIVGLENYLRSEYKRLNQHSNELLYSSDDNSWYDWNRVTGQMSGIARVMGYMGMELPDVEDSEC